MGIFAKVLETILTAHQESDFTHLRAQGARTDPIWYPLRRVPIASQVIDRLKGAASSDDQRATLNPIDLEDLIRELGLKENEQAQLRAALIAQGVEIFLYSRMTKEESTIISEIAWLIYNRLLERSEAAFNKVREARLGSEPAGDRASEPAAEKVREAQLSREADGDQQKVIAFSLVDHVETLIQALESAKERNVQEEVGFWQRLIVAGYQEIISLLLPVEPELAKFFEKALLRFQGN